MERICALHGTTSIYAPSILEEGLKPSVPGFRRNDEPAPRKEGVYLTFYAPHAYWYANHRSWLHGGRAMIVVVSLELPEDLEILEADEDSRKETWYDSVLETGNVCYRGRIEPNRIERIYVDKDFKLPRKEMEKLAEVCKKEKWNKETFYEKLEERKRALMENARDSEFLKTPKVYVTDLNETIKHELEEYMKLQEEKILSYSATAPSALQTTYAPSLYS